ncbi:MAG: UPF0182 family protein [Bifidobacteriaceae bacterium]|nr:UPF0182 family protein [Bifidobacteriaceae bacterium]
MSSFFGSFFPGGNGNNDDDPVVLNVETDGEKQSGSAGASRSSGGQPPRFQLPRLAGRPGGFLRKWLWIILAIVIVAVGLIFFLSYFGTEVMWYSQLGYGSVIWTTWAMKIGLWIIYAVVMGAVAYLSATLAIRSRPADADGSSVRTDGSVMEMVTSFSSKTARRVAVIIALILGALFGAQLVSHWNELLLLFHAQSFGTTDPQFGFDVGFYVFVLPSLVAITDAVLTMVIVGFLVCLLAQLALSGIRFRLPSRSRGILDMTKRARRQISIWLLLTMLLWGFRIVLNAFETLTEQGDRITGAEYSAVHATIPATFAMAALVAVLGIVLAVWIMRSHSFSSLSSGTHVGFAAAMRAWRFPVIAIASVIVAAMVLMGVYPALLQRFKVSPNAQELESTYISRNIKATSDAFGLNNVSTENYDASTQGESGALSKDTETTAQIRLLDPQVVAPTFRQLQQIKQYYNFTDTLSIDKYEIGGKSYDTVIGARELNLDGNDNRNWINDHTVFTHGYGVVAAYGNKVSKDGQPLFFEKNIPTQGVLSDTEKYQPRIYFSPNAPEYSIVGSPKGTAAWEFDYPTGSKGATNTFSGNAGPSVGNVFSKLLYSIRFGSDQIFFSDRVTSDSQILYDRSPVDRVRKVAPYLELDSRVYPAVVDGRVKWIVDAYTTSDMYPYSQKVDLDSATKDSLTATSKSMRSITTGQANYMRNSVKATVDAYDGSVDLYAWNPDDPVLKAWEGVFPGQYKPISSISSDLMSHMRYPESLFKVQRELLGQYHVTSASQFFSGEDFWQTPEDPAQKKASSSETSEASTSEDSKGALQPPYYLTMQLPKQANPTFSLSSSYIPAGNVTREILSGFLSVDSDAGHEKGKMSSNYGKLQLLELPKNSTVPGPGQAQNNFNANADVSKELNLLETGSTNVARGNLLTLPIGGGLVYVQPVYVQSSGSTSFPLLKKVLVAFGEQVGFADTLDEALDQVFGGDSGASAGDASNVGKTDSSTSSGATSSGSSDSAASGSASDSDASKSGSDSTSSGSSAATSETLKKALSDADQAEKDSQSAMKDGDWSKYGEAQGRLKDAIKRAVEASE